MNRAKTSTCGIGQSTSTTKTGETVIGTTLNEDTFSVQIRALDGAVRSFNRSELATLRVERDTSFMPSYRTIFDEAELDDLVAYLTTLRGRQ